MTSPRQIAANRGNAGRSTGPRSSAGKSRSARNAAKHGLSLSVLQDPILAPEVARLATARALKDPHFTFRADSARYLRLMVRALRAEETGRFSATERDATKWAEQSSESDLERHTRALKELAGELAKLDRYERRALSRRKFAIRRLDATRS